MRSFLFIISLIVIFLSASSYAKNIWEKQKAPATGNPEVIGTYTLGCMIGAETLPLDGYGYQVMRPARNRFYAQPEMYEYIISLAKNVKDNLHNVLIVGDVALPKGGPFTTGHRSHQIGLDADFWYSAPPAALQRKLSRVERDQISALNMVDSKNKTYSNNWSDYQKHLLKTAAGFDDVDRIFVNPAIKRELCKTDKGADWLHKIRPWYGHDDHFHVRLSCPANDNSCKIPDDYNPIKAGDGCDETLDWWFAKRTKAELDEMRKQEEMEKHKPKPKLPTKCLELLGKK